MAENSVNSPNSSPGNARSADEPTELTTQQMKLELELFEAAIASLGTEPVQLSKELKDWIENDPRVALDFMMYRSLMHSNNPEKQDQDKCQ